MHEKRDSVFHEMKWPGTKTCQEAESSHKFQAPVMGVEPILSASKKLRAYRCAPRVNRTHHSSTWSGIKTGSGILAHRKTC